MYQGRVIFGDLRGRIIKTPKTKGTRPTSDMLKESIFNVLIHKFYIDFSMTCVMDIFAGSGALGIESISLGSKRGLFIEHDRSASNCILNNLQDLGIKNLSRIITKNILKVNHEIFLEHIKEFDNILIFMDPPYKETDLFVSQVRRFQEILKDKNFMIIAETAKGISLDSTKHVLTQGDSSVSFIC
jgi:16S rRNA (guanine966-N2)-methyltransferase